MTYWLIPTSLPSIVLGHVWGGLLLVVRAAGEPHYKAGILVVVFRGWAASSWRYSTTIGHCVSIHPRHGERTWDHERLHIWQYEDLCLLGAVISGALSPWLGWWSFLLWGTSGAPWLLPNYLTGWIRFKDAYLGSEHERSAYAQTIGKNK